MTRARAKPVNLTRQTLATAMMLGKIAWKRVAWEDSRRAIVKEIGGELRNTNNPGLQNIEVIRPLLRLVQEGRVSKVLGSDRETRYSEKR